MPTTDRLALPSFNPFTTDGTQCVVVTSPTSSANYILHGNARWLEQLALDYCEYLSQLTGTIDLAYYGFDPRVYGDEGEVIGTDGFPDAVGTWDDEAEAISWECSR